MDLPQNWHKFKKSSPAHTWSLEFSGLFHQNYRGFNRKIKILKSVEQHQEYATQYYLQRKGIEEIQSNKESYALSNGRGSNMDCPCKQALLNEIAL